MGGGRGRPGVDAITAQELAALLRKPQPKYVESLSFTGSAKTASSDAVFQSSRPCARCSNRVVVIDVRGDDRKVRPGCRT